jgi:DNA polymerase-3 subunit gamma/tau
MAESVEAPEKKKPDLHHLNKTTENLPLLQKSEILREEISVSEKVISQERLSGKHDPVIEKASKKFSIKDIITEDIGPAEKNEEKMVLNDPEVTIKPKIDFTPQAFEAAWNEFTEKLKGEGTRVVSMFKSIRPELESDRFVRIHLNNAAQKDTFILNYKPKLVNFLEERFVLPGIDIETIVDLSEESDLLYSDEQKLNYLINKYPILKEMKKTFNLDIT